MIGLWNLINGLLLLNMFNIKMLQLLEKKFINGIYKLLIYFYNYNYNIKLNL